MPYTTREAIVTLSTYLGINLGVSVRSIDQTSNRGYEIRLPSGERCVIFVYPISHKQDDSKNFFDTRDSGARERGVAWNYAQTHNLKYFCLAVHDQVDKYKDYIFSLECDEHRITEVSGTLNGSRNGRGTQVVIPTSCIPSKNFERIYTDNGFYIAVVHKGHIYDYLEQYDNRPYMDKTLPLVDINDVEDDNSIVPSIPSPFTPCQIIYYGVPGCGKSHQINKKIKSIPDYNKIRTVFHPEYTNADFIGQILPEVCVNTNGHSVVEYKFNPGPFTEIVRRAYLNPDEEFFLVIEEINRGNAAAIFGDMFQLLDRLDADEKPEEVSSEHVYGKDWSSYGVDNPDINAYIRNQNVISQEKPDHCSKVAGSGEDANPRLYKSVDIESENVNVTWKEKNGNGFTPKPKHLHFSANTAIRLPPNLSIYATMNISDQNVFTLDNAFQRRWNMELVPNICKWNDEDHKNQAKSKIGDTDIRWETFRKAINSEISDGDFFNADDKQLGLFFIEAEGDKIDGKKFANKVLKYLWADVFKRDTGKIFKSENLSKVVEDFTGTDAFDKVFADEFVQSLKSTNDEIKNHE